MKALSILTTLLAWGVGLITTAQLSAQEPSPGYGADRSGRTMVKAELLRSLLTSSYNLQAERVLSKSISLQARAEYMSKGRLDFRPLPYEYGITDPKGFEVELALRLYTGRRGWGSGFYFQPFYNISRYRFESSDTYYLPKRMVHYDTKNKVFLTSFGVGIGRQWLLGRKRNIVLDWTILKLSLDPKMKHSIDYSLPRGEVLTADEIRELTTISPQGATQAFARKHPSADATSAHDTGREQQWRLSAGLSIGFRF